MRRRIVFALLTTFVATTTRVDAQELRGVVRDSASQFPIPGAVVTTLDSLGRVGRRSLTNELGAYFVTASPDAQRLRVVRLGFRPVDVLIPRRREGVTDLDVLMTRIPYQLQPVNVRANANCPRRSDRAAALALLEQARAGLLATIVARSERPAQMKRLMFDRRMEGTTDRIARNRVSIDEVPSAVAAFHAARSGAEFVTEGFSVDSIEGSTFFAPDADVLLDDDFAAGYCFHIMARNRARPNQVGLGFRSANRRRGRIDVDGAMWIDTASRSLVDIGYRYVGMDRRLDRFEPGGRVEFRTLPNGVVLIDHWVLRIVGVDQEATRGFGLSRARLENALVVADVGGELARATWPDGFAWAGDLGTLSLVVTDDDGAPNAGATIRLADTDYQATTDSTGHLEIPDLAPGPYSIHLVDKRLEEIGKTLETRLSFSARRGVTNTLTLTATTAENFVGDLCRRDPNVADHVGSKPETTAWVIGRVRGPNGEPLAGVRVAVKHDWFETGTDGVFVFCQIPRDAVSTFEFRKDGKVVGTMSRHFAGGLSAVAVQIDRLH